MGIIKAVRNSVGGSLADQWLEVIEADRMGAATVFARGVTVRPNDRRGQNRAGTENTVSNGSVIHVYPNQFMLLVDEGKVVDYTAQEGYYKVDNTAMPSLFNGEFGSALAESFRRIKYGGVASSAQKVYFINLQEIKGLKFGTRNPINYFDSFYNAELFLRTHGTYSVKIKDPLRFYSEMVPRNRERLEITEINGQLLNEFLEALQAAINQMSVDGIRISYVASKSRELGQYMSTILDEEWNRMRGMIIQSVGIASISYDEDSINFINLRNQGAMMGDPAVREGFVQSSVARGLEAAGSNAAGAMAGFMGVGLGAQESAGFMGAASQSNQQQMRQRRDDLSAGAWTCACGSRNTGKFCAECGKPRPEGRQVGEWVCVCGSRNRGKFCSECGKPRPAQSRCRCDKCGYEPDPSGPIPKFCPECGDPITRDDIV